MSALVKYMCKNCLKINKNQFKKILNERNNEARIFFCYLTDEKLNVWYTSIATKNQVYHGYIPDKYCNWLRNNGCFYKHINDGYYIRIDLVNDRLQQLWIINYANQKYKYIQARVYMQRMFNSNDDNFDFQLEQMRKHLHPYIGQFSNVLNVYDELTVELMAYRNLLHLL